MSTCGQEMIFFTNFFFIKNVYSPYPRNARLSVFENPCILGYLILKFFFVIFYIPKDILEKKVCRLFIFQGFYAEYIQIRPFFYHFWSNNDHFWSNVRTFLTFIFPIFQKCAFPGCGFQG